MPDRAPRTLASLRDPRLLLVGLLLLLAVPKLIHSAGHHTPGIDGGYYTDIAASVRDGRGLRTDVSLLHKGYPYFPHETDIYPLWPLLLGHLAKVFPLVPTGIWLPTALYFAALVGGYAWAGRVWPEPLLPRVGLHAGHVVVVVFGLSRSFFEMTSLPYTEGLAFTLLFIAMWRAHVLLPRRTLLAGVELGVWAGLLVLARTQLLLFFLAVAGALAVSFVAQRGRVRTVICGVGVVVAFGLVLTPEYLFLRSFIVDASPAHLLRFDQTQSTTFLSPYQAIRPVHGVGAFLADRARGFLVAFQPNGRGYWEQFYLFTYAPFLAVAALVAAAVRGADGSFGRRLHAWVREPASSASLFVALFVTGAFLSIHTMHKMPDAWYFHRRHALPSAFLLVAALVALLRGSRLPKAAGIVLLAGGVAVGAVQIAHTAAGTSRENPPLPPAALMKWIAEEKRRDPTLILALRRPQLVAWQTDGVGYHWYDDSTSAADFIALADHLGLDAVVLASNAKMRGNRAFLRRFRLATRLGKDLVFRPRERAEPDPAPPDGAIPTDDETEGSPEED